MKIFEHGPGLCGRRERARVIARTRGLIAASGMSTVHRQLHGIETLGGYRGIGCKPDSLQRSARVKIITFRRDRVICEDPGGDPGIESGDVIVVEGHPDDMQAAQIEINAGFENLMSQDNREKDKKLEWKLRVSPRARYARLQIKPWGGLEVVVPPRFPRHQIPSLVDKHADWARRQLARQAQLRESIQMPRRLELAFDNSCVDIVYRAEPLSFNYDLFAGHRDAGHRDAGHRDQIIIDASSEDLQRCELRAWVRKRARHLLPPMLARVAGQTGFDYKKVSIRSQKTRWGSCSRRGHISLNDQLMFVPADTVEYLMIHELCHTRHLNHSRDFWRLVERHCADYRRHEQLLGQSRDLVPDWFLLDLYT